MFIQFAIHQRQTKTGKFQCSIYTAKGSTFIYLQEGQMAKKKTEVALPLDLKFPCSEIWTLPNWLNGVPSMENESSSKNSETNDKSSC